MAGRNFTWSAALSFTFIAVFPVPKAALAQPRPQPSSPASDAALQPTSYQPLVSQPAAVSAQEKLARIWAHEPPLVHLARDHFGAAFSEIDAKFFASVAANEWADFRPKPDAKYDTTEPASWDSSPQLPADRINWLCTDTAAAKLVPSHGIWLRGAHITGMINLYRCDVPFSLTLYDCLIDDGLNFSHAGLQELDLRDSCSATINARAVAVKENIYLVGSTVLGGLDFIEAQIGGDFDFTGGLAFHGRTAEDIKKPGIAIDLYDAKIGGDVKLSEKFRSLGQVRLLGAQIGRSLDCSGGSFVGSGQLAIDGRRCQVAANVLMPADFRAEGGVEIRRSHIGGDLDCDGGRFIGNGNNALNADLVEVGGQVHLGKGFHAEGEVRLVNATVAGDVDCDNGTFLNASGDAISLDSVVIGRSLRMGFDESAAAAGNAEDKDSPDGFLARGTVRLWGAKIGQDILCQGADFQNPTGVAFLACNSQIGSRVIMADVTAAGCVNLFSVEIQHELDLRGGEFDGSQTPDRVAIMANGMHVHGHVECNTLDAGEEHIPLRVDGEISAQFATIGMHWDFTGVKLKNPGGYVLDASDSRVGGYVNLNSADIDGRMSFSRAKIEGVWWLVDLVHPERMQLDLRFAHIWVIKDKRLSDWPPAGQLQLEGFVYDHFDDDSPLDVEDRLAWLARQYPPAGGAKPLAWHARSLPKSPVVRASFEEPRPTETGVAKHVDAQAAEADSAIAVPTAAGEAGAAATRPADGDSATAEDANNVPKAFAPIADEPASDPSARRYVTQPYTQLASVYRAIGQDEDANRVLVARAERLGELSPAFSAQGVWYRYIGRLIGYGYEPFRAVKIGVAIVILGALVFAVGNRRNLMAETKLAEQVLSKEGEPRIVSITYPRFNALVYSLDVFLPFVDLQQICYWLPGEMTSGQRKSRNCLLHVGRWSLKWSALLRAYLWFQTLAGWTLTTLLAAAVTGIVKS